MSLFKKIKEFYQYGTEGRASSNEAFKLGVEAGLSIASNFKERDKEAEAAKSKPQHEKKAPAVKAKAPVKKAAAKKVVKKAPVKARAK